MSDSSKVYYLLWRHLQDTPNLHLYKKHFSTFLALLSSFISLFIEKIAAHFKTQFIVYLI